MLLYLCSSKVTFLGKKGGGGVSYCALGERAWVIDAFVLFTILVSPSCVARCVIFLNSVLSPIQW